MARVTVTSSPVYTLVLSAEEAQVIADVLLQVSGNSVKTRRGLADRVRFSLNDAGVSTRYNAATYYNAPDIDTDTHKSGVHFK